MLLKRPPAVKVKTSVQKTPGCREKQPGGLPRAIFEEEGGCVRLAWRRTERLPACLSPAHPFAQASGQPSIGRQRVPRTGEG
jgi:hypothetical protein